jgi:hypothetical protein
MDYGDGTRWYYITKHRIIKLNIFQNVNALSRVEIILLDIKNTINIILII